MGVVTEDDPLDEEDSGADGIETEIAHFEEGQEEEQLVRSDGEEVLVEQDPTAGKLQYLEVDLFYSVWDPLTIQATP